MVVENVGMNIWVTYPPKTNCITSDVIILKDEFTSKEVGCKSVSADNLWGGGSVRGEESPEAV